MIKLKPLVWSNEIDFKSKEPTGNLVSINTLAEFAILQNQQECESLVGGNSWKLEITYAGNQWDCFCYDTIDKCKERADIWLREVVEDLIISETVAQ